MEVGTSEKIKDDKIIESEDFDDSMEPVVENMLEDEQKKSDDDDDNEIEDDLESDDDDADENEVKKIEAILLVNPYDYPSHVSLIEKLRNMGELDRLRVARENMSSKYPLSPDIWLSWLKDEIKLVTTAEDRNAVKKLCERAVQDYLSVEVWLEYLLFEIGIMGSNKEGDSKNSIRQLFEKALTAVGLDVTKGAIIWEAFREFENGLISMALNEVEKKENIDRVAALFRRQLACPLRDMEKTYLEYQEWRLAGGKESSIDDNIVESGYKRALSDLNSRLPFEEKLISCQNNNELYDAYKAYFLYERKNGDPGRVCILYERALTDLSIESKLWIDYLQYVNSTLKLECVISPIYERAVRNVPWCSQIWKEWIRSLEKWEKPLLTIQSVLENALVAGFTSSDDYRNIWMTYLEYLRRRLELLSSKQDDVIENAFNRACEHLAKLFGLDGDPQCIILQFWARTEAIHISDMEKARSIWSDILSQGHSVYAASWLEYISLEKCYGDSKHIRKLYQKALNSVKDWPESIINSWLEFERDEGTLEQMEYCEEKTNDKLKKIHDERAKDESHSKYRKSDIIPTSSTGKKSLKRKQQDDSGKDEFHSKYGKSDIIPTSSTSKKSLKRKQQDDSGKWQGLGTAPNKQGKFEKPKQEITLNVEEKIKEKKEKIAPPPGYIPQDEHIKTNQEVDEQITVFISNLDYSATEEEVRNALAPAGPITLFKMVKDYKGRSKGFSYVQLSSSEAVEEALKLDRTPINGRPMFVSKCDPNKTTRGPGFKYACALEKNKIFIKGLPVTTTKEDLENLYKTHGTLKDIRLVTYRNGHSKGLAYVEFADENSAGKAVLATDGITIDDKIISVAISKPPERRKNPDDVQIKSLGGTSTSRTHFGVPKTLLSMIPRNVKPPPPPSKNGNSEDNANQDTKPMNNQDFRNMLLNKK